MKKMLFVMVIGLLLCLSISVFATSEEQNHTENKNIAEILSSQLSVEERSFLYNKEFYTSDLDVENKMIMKVYENVPIFYICNSPLDDIIKYAELHGKTKYVIFNDKNTTVKTSQAGNSIIVIEEDNSNVIYFNDIKSLESNIEIMGEQYDIISLFCFDIPTFDYGNFTYIVTDKGTFVKFYQHKSSEGIWFTESDFAKYGTAYEKYISSYEYNYNEYGEPLYGNYVSFEKYLNKIYGTEKDYGAEESSPPSSTVSSKENTTDSNDNVFEGSNQVTESKNDEEIDTSNQTLLSPEFFPNDKTDTISSNVQSSQNKSPDTDGSSDDSIYILITVIGALGVLGLVIAGTIFFNAKRKR